MLGTLNCFSILNNFLLDFPDERLLFKKEMSNKLYGALPYLLAKCIINIPITIFFTIIPTIICYYIVGLNSDFEVYMTAIAI